VRAKVRKGSPGGRSETTRNRIWVMGEGIGESGMEELVPEWGW